MISIDTSYGAKKATNFLILLPKFNLIQLSF